MTLWSSSCVPPEAGLYVIRLPGRHRVQLVDFEADQIAGNAFLFRLIAT